MNKRNEICEAARKLFAECGYENVSLRDIAKEANTTIGNLSYLFPKKELLLSEIVNIRQIASSNKRPKIDGLDESNVLPELLKYFDGMCSNVQDFIYYFKNMIELGNAHEQIHKYQVSYRTSLFEYFSTVFSILLDNGYFRSDLPDGCYQALAEQIVFSFTLWCQNGSPTADGSMPELSLSQMLTNLLLPYFTEKGRRQYAQFVETGNSYISA